MDFKRLCKVILLGVILIICHVLIYSVLSIITIKFGNFALYAIAIVVLGVAGRLKYKELGED